MKKGFSSMLNKWGLTTDEGASAGDDKNAIPVQQQVKTVVKTPLRVFTTESADEAMVNNLRDSVFGASPIITQFMLNVEIARNSFPGDEIACMKAAIAFTRVDKATLLAELDRTVSAALTLSKKNLEIERNKAREEIVGKFEKELVVISNEIKDAEMRIVDLQKSVAQKRTETSNLQGQIQNAEMDLKRQDGIVNASFARVDQIIDHLKQTFSK